MASNGHIGSAYRDRATADRNINPPNGNTDTADDDTHARNGDADTSNANTNPADCNISAANLDTGPAHCDAGSANRDATTVNGNAFAFANGRIATTDTDGRILYAGRPITRSINVGDKRAANGAAICDSNT